MEVVVRLGGGLMVMSVDYSEVLVVVVMVVVVVVVVVVSVVGWW